jgi:hypothetical protein
MLSGIKLMNEIINRHDIPLIIWKVVFKSKVIN